MVRLAQTQSFFAQPFNGRMFDCGSKEGFIQANIAFALARDDMKDPFSICSGSSSSRMNAGRSRIMPTFREYMCLDDGTTASLGRSGFEQSCMRFALFLVVPPIFVA